MLLDLIINISTLGIQAKQEKIASQLLSALLHQFLMAKATLYWIDANLDNGTNINMVKTRGVVASAHDGIITLSGLDNGEVVKFYAADGKYLGSSVAANGSASYAVNESLVIAKVGKDSMKIAVK